jgi:serine/threonine protein kinase
MTDQLVPGQIFAGRYRIQRFIAKGGFGLVYAAEQIDTEAKVALKVIWSHVVESEDALEQFKLEARLASRVGSDHVARVFDVGRDSETDRPFLAMELLEGQHFEELVRTNGPVAPGALAEYFRQIGYALDRAHGYVDKDGVRRPIVHRDLKPENLFLTKRDGGAPSVKILDFGLAKMVGDAASLSHELKGTPLFMAFEQASVGPITPQTDIWALGLIAFYLLTGRCYWVSANTPESPFTRLFTEVLSAPLAPPSLRAQAVSAPVIPSPAFDAWFARCVIRDRNKRFDTAGECVEELARALGEPAPSPTVASFVPDAMPTVRSVAPESISVPPVTPGTAIVKRRSTARRLTSVLFAGAALVLAAAGFLALRRSSGVTASADEARAVVTAGATAAPTLPEPPTIQIAPAATAHPSDEAARTAAPPPRPPHIKSPPPAPSAKPPNPEDPYDHR